MIYSFCSLEGMNSKTHTYKVEDLKRTGVEIQAVLSLVYIGDNLHFSGIIAIG
jgi:hypothetical protein